MMFAERMRFIVDNEQEYQRIIKNDTYLNNLAHQRKFLLRQMHLFKRDDPERKVLNDEQVSIKCTINRHIFQSVSKLPKPYHI